MIAILNNDEVIDLGAENMNSIRRAGRLYKKGVFKKLVLEKPVPSCGFRNGHPIGGYWTLALAGLVSRELQPNYFADGDDSVYTVVANVEFTDENGCEWRQGDVDIWAK